MQQPQLDPLWDEGISSFLYGEYEKRQQALTIDDLQMFANEHAVRIGDILETLFLMAIYGEWIYADAEGRERVLDEDALNELYAKGRLGPEDLSAFDGVWIPIS
ncbi:hypothetical protein ACUNV4_19515 [Granulosicoccus sp. 3-233]|uniref:hypothetical protein n=1 Tax=Granulosicoccus sp. 3-233 TaxID=3417969 RepID=UPI003D345079